LRLLRFAQRRQPRAQDRPHLSRQRLPHRDLLVGILSQIAGCGRWPQPKAQLEVS
jgi:hypothetical protein